MVLDEQQTQNDDSPAPSRGRWIALRLAAVAVGLSPFILAEAGLRWIGWRPVAGVVDPFVGFHGGQALFALQEGGERLAIPPARQEFFEPDSFAATKAEDEFRVFCLGGSTVQGRPYSIKTSFTTWLELNLRAADPSRRWEVVNCGGVSYASYRLAPILGECLGYQPDLIVLYTGHNEFLEQRSYPVRSATPAWVARSHQHLSASRLYQFALSNAPRGKDQRTTLPAEVDALLDYRGGLETYHRDDQWRIDVTRHFEINLRRMIGMARDAGVPIILVDPVSNVRDCPPFKVESANSLTDAERKLVDTSYRQAREIWGDEPDRSLELVATILKIDQEHAGGLFLLGRHQLANGDTDDAGSTLRKAKDADVCPLRMLESMHKVLRRVASETQTPLAEVRRGFQLRAKEGIPGDELMIDHVHPRIEGHRLIAEILLEKMVETKLVASAGDALKRRRALHAEHWKTIDEVYMQRGEQKLEGLRRWTEGRAFKTRTP